MNSASPSKRNLTHVARALSKAEALPASAQPVASSRATRVARVAIEGKHYYAKVFLPRGRWEAIKEIVRGSRAKRAAQAADTLTAAGFATPAVIAQGGMAGTSWLVTESVPGLGLGLYADAFFRGQLSPARLAWKRQVIRALGDLVGRLHRAGIVHGDLRLNNILIDTVASRPSFYLIDNERNLQFTGMPPKKLLIKNLVQVSLLYPVVGTRTDRLRFVHSYAAQLPELDSESLRAVLQEVQGKSKARLEVLSQRPPASVSIAENVPNVPA